MPSLLEEGICIVRNKKAAATTFEEISKNAKGMYWEEIEKRAKRARRCLKGERNRYKRMKSSRWKLCDHTKLQELD